MFRGYGKMGFRGFPKRMLESGANEFGRYGAQYDWDAGYGITLNGSNVSAWRDRIQGRTWVQATAASQPTFVSSVALINNNPTLECAPATNNIHLTTPDITLGSNWWYAFVVNNNSLVGEQYILGNSTSTAREFAISIADGLLLGPRHHWTSGTSYRYASSVTASTSYGIVIYTPTKIYYNGVNQTIVNVSGAPSFFNPIRTLNILLRGENNGFRNHRGNLSRLIIGNQALSDSSLLELSDALNSKYLIY